MRNHYVYVLDLIEDVGIIFKPQEGSFEVIVTNDGKLGDDGGIDHGI